MTSQWINRWAGRARRGGASSRGLRGRLWRGTLRALLLVVVGILLLEAVYLTVAAVLLPRQLMAEARRAGFELTFASLRSLYPGSIHLDTPQIVAPGAGMVRAEQLDVVLHWFSVLGGSSSLERAQAWRLQCDWDQNHLGPFHVEVRARPEAAAGPAGWAVLSGPGARLRLPEWSARFDLNGRVQLTRPDGKASDLRFAEGEVRADSIDWLAAPQSGPSAGSARHHYPALRASLHWQEAALSRERGISVEGRLAVEGTDAGIWLDLARASSTVRWMLDELIGQPFQLEAALRIQNGAAAIEQLQLETGQTRLRGALYDAGDTYRGAFLALRGAGSIGVSIDSRGVTARLMPDPEWLPRELAQLALEHGKLNQ